MNKITRMFVAAAAVASCAMPVLSETLYDWTTSGSYSVGKAQDVTIPEDGEVYLKLSGLKEGKPFTFVANGSGASVEVVYTYSEDGDVMDDTLATGADDLKTADQNRCIVYYDDWTAAYIVIEDPEDKEWKVSPKGYYLHVMGDEGAVISLNSQSGAVEEPIPEGDPDNPKVIKPTKVMSMYSGKFYDGFCYFTFTATAGTKYLLSTAGGTEEAHIELSFDGGTAEYVVEDKSAAYSSAGNSASLVTVSKAGTVDFYVAGTGDSFVLNSQSATAGTLGRLTVNTKGTDATWSIKGASGKYESGAVITILGQQTISFQKVAGFSTPADIVVTPEEGASDITVTGVYNDTFDPNDDTVAGATKITPSAKVQAAARTLFAEVDEADHFLFSAKEGVYYNFRLTDLVGDAAITVFKKGAKTLLAGPSAAITKFAPGVGDYIVCVSHTNLDETVDAQYTLEYSGANVGAISFAKTAVSAKKSAGTVSLTVNRSSGEGKVRVKYGTVNGTAKPGVDYVAQSGELVWENGDKKAKTITIKLLPELFAATAISRTFEVQLKPVDEEALADDEYLASITSGKDVALVTVTEAKGTPEKAVKVATGKAEAIPLETGTYQGVIAEDGSALENGFPALAAITFTAKNATKKALSAKVVLAGKTYTFAADTWDDSESDKTTAVAIMTLQQAVNKITYVNTLRIAVTRGATATAGDWKKSAAFVELTMNVPDATGKGVQEDIVYSGKLFRDNSTIQGYLDAVVAAAGYYTVSLVPFGVSSADGIPAGNGYLTLTIDNKGKAKIAGMLADGTTKPSYTSIVAVDDDGETLLVPVYVAKSPYCFGGTLKFFRGADGKYVVDSSESLLWNNDDAALTYDGEAGWSIALDPVGGYYNTVNNLQAYYLTHDVSVSTIDASDLLAEGLASGYAYVTEAQPNGLKVSLVGNTLSTDKKSIVKNGKAVDFSASVNPCNVQVKLARATGLVTGSFSAWTENADGAQKEITNLKHNGVLILSRDDLAPLSPDVMTAGFFNQTATITYYNEKNQKKTRKYTASNPFNVLAVDQGEPDWYADDWGERPQE